MVPLQLYKSSGASLSTDGWRVIDGGALNPWNVMSWGLRQLKGLMIGSDIPGSPTRFQELELVLMSNLKVCSTSRNSDSPQPMAWYVSCEY